MKIMKNKLVRYLVVVSAGLVLFGAIGMCLYDIFGNSHVVSFVLIVFFILYLHLTDPFWKGVKK